MNRIKIHFPKKLNANVPTTTKSGRKIRNRPKTGMYRVGMNLNED